MKGKIPRYIKGRLYRINGKAVAFIRYLDKSKCSYTINCTKCPGLAVFDEGDCSARCAVTADTTPKLLYPEVHKNKKIYKIYYKLTTVEYGTATSMFNTMPYDNEAEEYLKKHVFSTADKYGFEIQRIEEV